MVSTQLAQVGALHRQDPEFREGYRYSVWHVVRLFLFLLWKGCSSNVLYQELSGSPGFRRRWRLPTRLISHSQFKKRRGTPTFLKALLELLRHSGARALRVAGLLESRVLVTDLTRLPSDAWRDPYGAWGFDSKGLFFGYKLGLITSEHGVLLGLTLMKANWTEFHVNGKLLRMARETLETRASTASRPTEGPGRNWGPGPCARPGASATPRPEAPHRASAAPATGRLTDTPPSSSGRPRR
jgi:hypothetical protein